MGPFSGAAVKHRRVTPGTRLGFRWLVQAHIGVPALMYRAFLLLLAATALSGCDFLTKDDPAAQIAGEWQVDPQAVTADALRAAIEDEDLRKFYEARQWRAAWDQDRVGQLTAALHDARRHALDHVPFLPGAAPEGPVAREVALTRAALGYGKALAQGLVDPSRIWPIYTVPRAKADIAAGLGAGLESGKVAEWLGSLAPQTEEYRALSAAYLAQLDRLTAAPDVGGGGLIKVGQSDPRVPALVQALQANGYLAAPKGEEQQPQVYTPGIATGVKRLQADYGIKADGMVGPETLEVLNTGPAERARQLAVNLERRRWLDRRPAETRIDVNTAGTFLDYWRDGGHRDRRRVVVGQPDWETPQLGSPIFQLVANPTWTVPESIEVEEIAPKGPGYLARNNMVRRNGRIVQLPGPENSLGQVKFDMKNDQAIYLHDTPAKALFAENERHRSHGCVRVEDALGFAQMLAGDDGILPAFQQAMQGKDEDFVGMKREVPVRLLYHTVFLDGGALHFRTDAYGWDEDLAGALSLKKRTRRPLKSRGGDIGP
jgi:murein L,D-transpeptidase YcbB/YkuD